MEDSLQSTLRDSLTASFDAIEENQAEQVRPEPVAQETVSDNQESTDSRNRDDQGRFANKNDEPVQAVEAQPKIEPVVEQPIQRPTTWKKEYLPIWEKISKGEAITPDESKNLAAYSMQREKEYATGVSTYRAEAQNAKHLTEALTPFIPLMQERGLSAPAFINTLGMTMNTLIKGSPQQKMQALANLANDVGVPLHTIAQTQGGQQVDPVVPQLLEYIQTLEGKVNTVASSWNGYKEQQDNQVAQQAISKFENAEHYPHFQQVRGTMGQLLVSGFTQDLEQAYKQAVRMNDDVWEAEQARQAQLSANIQSPNKTAAVMQAKARAVSPRSVTPSGTQKTVNAKDVRSLLETAFDSHSGSRV